MGCWWMVLGVILALGVITAVALLAQLAVGIILVLGVIAAIALLVWLLA